MFRVVSLLVGSLMAALSMVCLSEAQTPNDGNRESGAQSNQKVNPGVVLRAETRLVQLNVIVEDRKGLPVEDLKKEDFALFDNGKPQNIVLFSSEPAVAPVPSTANSDAKSELKREPRPNVFANRSRGGEAIPGSVTVILFDALNTSFADQAYARTQILAFLRQLRPDDHVAIYLLTTQLVVVNEFTHDSKSLLQAVERFQASPSLLQTEAAQQHVTASDPGVSDFKAAQHLANLMNDMTSQTRDIADVRRVEITAQAIEAIASHVATIPGRKNLVWVSGSFPISLSLDSPDQSAIAKRSQNFTPVLERVARALNQSNLAIYPVDARGLPVPSEFDTSNAHAFSSSNPAIRTGEGQGEDPAMNLLAERTGGHAFHNTNDIRGAVRRTMADSRFTYVLGYYPDHGNWNGQYHTILLRVKRGGSALRYRKGYFAVADPPDTTVETQNALQTAAWSPVDATGLGMQAKIQTIDPATRHLDLRVNVEVGDVRFVEQGGRRKGSIDAIFLQLGPGDKVMAVQPLTYKMDFDEKEYRTAVEHGYELKAPLVIHGMTRNLRLVLRDPASGQLGSVTVPLERFLAPQSQAN
jgi:VWFA-related protein